MLRRYDSARHLRPNSNVLPWHLKETDTHERSSASRPPAGPPHRGEGDGQGRDHHPRHRQGEAAGGRSHRRRHREDPRERTKRRRSRSRTATGSCSASTPAPTSRSTARSTSSCARTRSWRVARLEHAAPAARVAVHESKEISMAMAKQITYGDEARQAILRGVNRWPTPSRSRSAPRAATSSSTRSSARPLITKDGVTVAKEIELEEPLREHGRADGARGRVQDLATSPATAPPPRPCWPRRSSARASRT